MIDNFDMMFYTLAFIVPGFITYTIVSIFVPQKSEQTPHAILKFLYFSGINYALWAWLIYIIVKINYYNNHPYRTAGLWVVIILISPLITGIIFGILSKKEIFRKLLQRIGFNIIHPIPTAWDYKFSTIQKGIWILVTLKDDSTVLGYFGQDSFASSDSIEHDIYIERVYRICENGQWEETSRTDGILIKGDQIKLIEFFIDEEDIYGKETTE